MPSSAANSRRPNSRNFSILKDRMLLSDELPLAEVLDNNQWKDIFEAHQIELGSDEDSICTPAIILEALISQAFFNGEMRSCKATVGRVATLWLTLRATICNGRREPTAAPEPKSPSKPFATFVAKSQ